jgi:hypothetical protein
VPLIGTLTVDLVANTASFSGDLGKAAQSAEEFGAKAAEAGNRVDFSMKEAKGSMMLMGEELGVHIPRHLQALIAEIPGVGLVFAEMLPIVGVIAAIAIIAKLIAKNDEAKEKLAQGWDKFGTESVTVFDALDDKMIQVEKRADELAGRHLAALRKELELIDHASLRELAAEFGKLEKAGHSLMVEMKSSWYEIRMGSQGAENALTRFTGEYDLLLAKGDKKGAFDKLTGTLNSANQELAKMVSLEGSMYAPSQKHVDAQRLLVSILEDQLRVSKEVEAINAGEKTNKKTEESQAEAGREYAVYERQQKGLEQRRKAEERYAKELEKVHKEAAKEHEETAKTEYALIVMEAEHAMKVQEGLAKEELNQSTAMAKIQESAENQAAKRGLAMHQSNAKEAMEAEVQAADKCSKTELAALDKAITNLNKNDVEYLVKKQSMENKQTQIVQQAANEQTEIRQQAAEKQFKDVSTAEERMSAAIEKNISKGIVESKNMAAAFKQMGVQMAETALENLLQMETIQGKERLGNARKAATDAWAWASNPILGAVLAPLAFAAVMAFEDGGKVPGTGPVPSMNHGGETVVTKALTDRVEASEGRGKRGAPQVINFHLNVKDADSFKQSHSQIIAKQQHAAQKAARRNR